MHLLKQFRLLIKSVENGLRTSKFEYIILLLVKNVFMTRLCLFQMDLKDMQSQCQKWQSKSCMTIINLLLSNVLWSELRNCDQCMLFIFKMVGASLKNIISIHHHKQILCSYVNVICLNIVHNRVQEQIWSIEHAFIAP